ncbi:Beta-1,4-galactosyltransferase 3 [Dermatophagoides farinae]|uniref:Beta-1,4-galactosyltransferase 3 n=1 Tax=Dermatophagoides farinae TaxID=6954 RepID=A0A922IAF0_DERFA|nr:Beta-1,4-galactosyltransferase 3 [Dermatophagoides farinae]
MEQEEEEEKEIMVVYNQTRTTSFSIHNELPNIVISSDVGFGFCKNALSNATRVLVSILVRFLRLRPLNESTDGIAHPLDDPLVDDPVPEIPDIPCPLPLPGCNDPEPLNNPDAIEPPLAPPTPPLLPPFPNTDPPGLFNEASASSSHRCNNGFNLHIFLKLRFNASKREMVV